MNLPLIPREVLFSHPRRANPQVSPDGKFLTYLAPDDNGVLQIWLRTIGQTDDRMLTREKKRGPWGYFWGFDGRQIFYFNDIDGDENGHLFGIDLATGQKRDYTPFDGVQARYIAHSPEVPGSVLVGLNIRDRRYHDVYRIDLRTGAVEMVEENPGDVSSVMADNQLRIRGCTVVCPDGGTEARYRPAPGGEWKVLARWPFGEDGGMYGLSADGTTLYFTSNLDANAGRLMSLDIATGRQTVLAEGPQYDIYPGPVHPRSRKVQAVLWDADHRHWRVLDEDIAPDFAAIEKVRRGDFYIASRDLADRVWTIVFQTDDGPEFFHLYDRATRKATLLFSSKPDLENVTLAQMKPVSFTARDGLTIPGFLSLPPGTEDRQDACPTRNLPAVLLVHGGPQWRYSWGFHSEAQWLANRGYAVFQVNFRGSTGYGKKFEAAGNREWGGKMHDDLVDAVKWLIGQGIADERRIAIMGGSYGGYATLVGMTFTPELFACGVSLVGISNLVTFLRTIPPYWAPFKAMWAKQVGDPDTEEDFLKSRSPITFVDRIRSPLLIGHGKNDARVNQAESEQIVATMKSAGKPVQYVLYPDEGHGLGRAENRMHFNALTEQFLAKYLGGRAEPMGEIKGHSGIVS